MFRADVCVAPVLPPETYTVLNDELAIIKSFLFWFW
jgi:hypothetical protein